MKPANFRKGFSAHVCAEVPVKYWTSRLYQAIVADGLLTEDEVFARVIDGLGELLGLDERVWVLFTRHLANDSTNMDC